MASIQRIYFLAGSAAAALAVALPVHAEETLTQPSTMADLTESAEAAVTSVKLETTEKNGTVGLEMTNHLSLESDAVVLAETFELLDAGNEVGQVVKESDETPVAEESVEAPVDVALVDAADVTFNESVSTSAESFFASAGVTETSESAVEGQEIAQVTRPLYRGVSPFYVGIGGNIGIVDSDESALGDFGFDIISKISFGPRFSVRPNLAISEDDVSLAVPITYNLNPIEVSNVNLYPYGGVGADISEEIGLLINGGVDIPISREFTLNGQLNWRATNDAALGITLGVGYNFPFFFE